MGPALIGQEIDASVDFTLRIIYAGGVCVFSQSGRVISTETGECSQTTAEGVIPDRREPYRRVPLGRVHLDERRLDEVQ